MMLKVISDKNRIAQVESLFKSTLLSFNHEMIETNIGYQSGSVIDKVYWFPDLRIWGLWRFPPSTEDAAKRYWNAFGVDKPYQDVSIVCEINPSLMGINRRVAGAFAEDPSGREFLLHRGRFNISGGMSMAFFESRYQKGYVTVQEGSSASRFVQIGEINQANFGNNLAEFVFEVNRIKNLARGRVKQ